MDDATTAPVTMAPPPPVPPQFDASQPTLDVQGNVVSPIIPNMQQPVVAAQPAAMPANPAQYAVQVAPPPAPPQPVSPVQQATAQLSEEQKKGAENYKQAIADKALVEDETYDLQQKQLAARMTKELKDKKDFDSAYSGKVLELDDMSKKLASSDFSDAKIDSNRFWNNQSTGSKILGAISIGLAGYGSALAGRTDNQAFNIIQKAIDRDIEEQKFNLQHRQQNLKDQINVKQNMLETLRTKYGSDMQAEQAWRILANDGVQNKIKMFTAKTDNQLLTQNANIMLAKLEQEKQIQLQALKTQELLQQKIASGSGGQLSPMEMAALPKELRETVQADQERSVPGFQGRAPTKEVAGKFIEQSTPIQQAIGGANTILAMSKDLNRVTDPKKKAQIATEIKSLAGQLRVPLTGPGALTEKEFDRLMDIVGDPTSLTEFPSLQRARLEQVKAKLTRDLDTLAEGHGFRQTPEVTAPMKPYQGR